MKEKGLDVGFAYDGDADRCLCADEHGNVVDGDAILYIYGAYLKEHGELAGNTVTTTIMSISAYIKLLINWELITQKHRLEINMFMNIWHRQDAGSAESSPDISSFPSMRQQEMVS